MPEGQLGGVLGLGVRAFGQKPLEYADFSVLERCFHEISVSVFMLKPMHRQVLFGGFAGFLFPVDKS